MRECPPIVRGERHEQNGRRGNQELATLWRRGGRMCGRARPQTVGGAQAKARGGGDGRLARPWPLCASLGVGGANLFNSLNSFSNALRFLI